MIKIALLSIALAATAYAVPNNVAKEAETPEEPETSQVSSEGEEEEKADAFVHCSFYHKDEGNGELIEDVNNKYGDIILSSENGKEGDVVSAIVQANPTLDVQGKTATLYRYVVYSVELNGTRLEAINDKYEYEFTLVGGQNNLVVTFSGKAEISITNLAETNWKALLTVDNLVKVITLAVLLLVSSGFFITLIRGRKIKSITGEEFARRGEEAIKNAEKIFLEKTVKPLLESQSEQNKETIDTIKTLLRVTLLAQENTPEARSAIIKELQQAKNTDQDLAKKIQEIVDQSIKDRDEAELEKQQKLEEAKTTIEELKPIEDKGGYDGTSI